MQNPTVLEDRIIFDDLEIMILTNDSADLAKRDDIYYMQKSLPYLPSYEKIRSILLEKDRIDNIFEIGVFRGGSTPYLHRFFEPRTLSCIDLVPGVVPLDRYAAQVAPSVKVHYSTDQSDKAALRAIIEEDFVGPIDLVVDDASHLYGPTKATFEAVFPYLRHGGVYVVEDWSWSHGADAQSTNHYWWRQDSLSNFIFELLGIYGNHSSGLITSVNFAPGLMWVVKGWGKAPSDFKVAEFSNFRGRPLSLL